MASTAVYPEETPETTPDDTVQTSVLSDFQVKLLPLIIGVNVPAPVGAKWNVLL